jgi:hypothetical protein
MLIAKVILLKKKSQNYCNFELMSGCKGGKWQEDTLLTYPTPSQPFPNLI